MTSAACQATERIFCSNDCDTVAFGAYVCGLATTSFNARDAELPFGTRKHG